MYACFNSIYCERDSIKELEVKADDGTVIGRYGIQDGMITVCHSDGWEKTTMASAAGDNEGLARLILSEPPPTH